MQDKFTPYPENILPSGFIYPQKYLQLAKDLNIPDKFIWWFEDSNTKSGQLAWALRNRYGEWKGVTHQNLVPFAQFNDDAALFDGNDSSGDPKVIIVDLGNKERSYELKNFNEWLHKAYKDAGIILSEE